MSTPETCPHLEALEAVLAKARALAEPRLAVVVPLDVAATSEDTDSVAEPGEALRQIHAYLRSLGIPAGDCGVR